MTEPAAHGLTDPTHAAAVDATGTGPERPDWAVLGASDDRPPARVLAVASSGVGHLVSLIPSLWAVRNAGAAVLVGATGPAVALAERAGLPVVDLAPDCEQQFSDIRGGYVRQMPSCPPSQRFALAMAMFADLAAQVTAPATRLGEAWRADVVLHTPLQPAGSVVATVLDVPDVEHGFQLTGVGRTLHLMRSRLAHACPVLAGEPVRDPTELVDVCPPSMHPGGPVGAWLGYRPYGGGGRLSPSLVANGGPRPRIMVSVGTTGQDGSLLQRTIDALSDRGWDLLVAGLVGPEIRRTRDVVDAGWLPFDPVLRTCDVLVHHGGAGSVLTALAYGVPQVVVSGAADHAFNAAALDRRGAGLGAEIDEVGPEGVAQATATVLENPRWREGASQVALEMARTPGPGELLPRLVRSLVSR